MTTKELIQDLIDALETLIENWTYGFINYEYDSDDPDENLNRDKILKALDNAKNYIESIE